MTTGRTLRLGAALLAALALTAGCARGSEGGTAATTPSGPASTSPSTPASPSAASSPSSPASPSRSAAPTGATRLPTARHVFVVNLENKSYESTFRTGSPAPYLSTQLPAQGALLTQYYGIAHNSLSNYLAQISGQGPNPATQADCGTFARFVQTGWTEPRQALGNGCVFPAQVPTLVNQMEDEGLTWRGYMEDMGTPCRHPTIDGPDTMHAAQVGDQYAVRHNPFVYFQAISESSCRANVLDLGHLGPDLASVSTTPNLSYITPNLCHDGHDSPCVDGSPGGLAGADAWLQQWVPRILASPAFRADGVLVVTFDEAETHKPGGADACCGQTTMPNAPRSGISGPGGGRVGAVVLSPFVTPGTTSDVPYNQFSLLRTVEDLFGLPPLGYAARAHAFGSDVWTAAG